MCKLLKRNEVQVSKLLDENIPVLIVDFDNFNLSCAEDKKEALKISRNLINIKDIYTTSKDNSPITELHNYKKLNDWTIGNGELFLSDLADSGVKEKIQLCGIYRELCIVEVASLIKKSALNIEPIIIDNDDYSISAVCSVAEGDTLENRLLENNFIMKVITA